MQPRGTDEPAYTVRRHLLNVKEDNIQIEQMKKVKRRVKVVNKYLFLFF